MSMAVNRGKKFEEVIRKSFLKVPNVSVDRLHDQTTGYVGSKNVCDFIVYQSPLLYYIECKTVHGDRLPFSNITQNQWDGLMDKSKIQGVNAGIMCWWVDHDVTAWLSMRFLNWWKNNSHKSVRYDNKNIGDFDSMFITGKKKRIFYDYDMKDFLDTMWERTAK